MKKVILASSIIIFMMTFLIIPIYASSVEFGINIEPRTVSNDKVVDFEDIPANDIVVINNVTKTTSIIIPPDIIDAKIKFEGDAIQNNIVQFNNDVTIDAKNMNALIEIKNQTSISNDNWNGEFIFSKTVTETIPDQADVISYQIGNDLVSLTFNPPFKIIFKDSANHNLFVTSAGEERVQITKVCNSDDVSIVDNIPVTYPKSCFKNVGNDLITITAQASVFSTSTDTSSSSSTKTQSTSTKNNGGGNSGKSPSPNVCGGVLCTDVSKKDTYLKQTEKEIDLKQTEKVLPDVNQNPWSDFPLKTQIKKGIPIDLIECRNGLELFLKQTTLTPVCISNSTAEKLMERNWLIKP